MTDLLDFLCLAAVEAPTATAQQKGAFVRNGRVRFFEKKNVTAARATWWHVLEGARRQLARPLEGPVWLGAMFVWPYTSATGKRVRDSRELLPMDKRPDVDNVLKAMLDTMTTIGFWLDDGQIASLAATKWRGPSPLVVVAGGRRVREADFDTLKAAKDARTVQAFQTGRDGVGLSEVRDVWCEMLIKCGTPMP